MAINSKITPRAERPTFPRLMEQCSTHEIVLLISEKCGVVVACVQNPARVGHYSSMWNADAFDAFTGSVTLTSEG